MVLIALIVLVVVVAAVGGVVYYWLRRICSELRTFRVEFGVHFNDGLVRRVKMLWKVKADSKVEPVFSENGDEIAQYRDEF